MNKVLETLNIPEYETLIIGAELLEENGNDRYAEAFRWIAKSGYRPILDRQHVKYRWHPICFERAAYGTSLYWRVQCLQRLLNSKRFVKKLDAYIALAKAYLELKNVTDLREQYKQLLQRRPLTIEQQLKGL